MKTGIVSNFHLQSAFYDVEADGNLYRLPFEECEGERYVPGDLIEFDEVDSTSCGKTALNPSFLYNQYFAELSALAAASGTITGYVYKKTAEGFNVTYKGFNCYLPSYNAGLNVLLSEGLDGILHTYQTFSVEEIRNDFVILSRRKHLKAERAKLAAREVQSLSAGQVFTGRIKSVLNFGVFVTRTHSAGLLHISNIIPNLGSNLTKQAKLKYGKLLAAAFPLGSEILVRVGAVTDGKYLLGWETETPPNSEVFSKVKEMLAADDFFSNN